MTHEVLSSEELLESGKPNDARILSNGIGGLAKIWQAYISYRSDRAGRHHVNNLSDHLLADIGITRQEAEELDRKKAWRRAQG